jgi:hypothetical protein
MRNVPDRRESWLTLVIVIVLSLVILTWTVTAVKPIQEHTEVIRDGAMVEARHAG